MSYSVSKAFAASGAIPYPAEKVRTVRFSPYRKGMGPTFTLHLFDVHSHDTAGRWGVGYRLTARDWRTHNAACLIRETTVLFECLNPEGAAYGHHAVDGDEAVKNVMGWLTLKPGDTDADYFAKYTPAQLAFCSAHAEALSLEVMNRFGDDDEREPLTDSTGCDV